MPLPDAHIVHTHVCLKYLCLGQCHDPEVYPRPDGTVYMCGFNDESPLPESAKDVAVNGNCVKNLHKMAGTISSSLVGKVFCIGSK